MRRNFIQNSFNKINLLKQITKLIFHCHHLLFEQILDLLSYTTNIQVLEFDSKVSNRTDSLSIEQNDRFQLVSNTNRVKNVTIRKEITLDRITLCIHLFSRLESLTIDSDKTDIKSIVRFILLESNDHIRYLLSLSISAQHKDFLKPVKYLIDSGELLRDYAIKFINQEVY